MIRALTSLCVYATVLVAGLFVGAAASAACTPLSSAADVENMSATGDYCLTGDIAFVQAFRPLVEFNGELDGKGHALSGLENNLFDTLNGTVQDLRVVGAHLDKDDGFSHTSSSRNIGIIAGGCELACKISNVAVSGLINLVDAPNGTSISAGGLVGEAFGANIEITDSTADVTILASPDTSGLTVGGLAGNWSDGKIERSHAYGSVQVGESGHVGGFVGLLQGNGSISGSSAEVDVDGQSNTFAGGFAGLIGPAARIEDSSAVGQVALNDGNAIGGFAGANFGTVATGVATGVVVAGSQNAMGGFIGENSGTVSKSLATGRVIADEGSNRIGGFFGGTSGTVTGCTALGGITGTAIETAAGGFSGETFVGGHTEGSYAVGKVDAGPRDVVGGFNGVLDSGGQITNSFWSPQTTGQAKSQGGEPVGLGPLLSKLQPGFTRPEWAQTKDVSLPYLNINFLGGYFHAQLATVIKDSLKSKQAIPTGGQSVYVFAPLGQFDAAAYRKTVAHQDAASLGAVYAMLARGIGATDGVRTLENMTIDAFFDDTTQKTKWRAILVKHARRAAWSKIPPREPLGENNVIGAIRNRHVVIVNGLYDNGDGRKNHYLLATSFTEHHGALTGLVADDPWTGQQVLIDPVKKTVTAPADYPLKKFRVTRFQPVTLDE